jgi:hypothetical protein
MQTENLTITLTPSLKIEGRFLSDQALVQASFEALEREWRQKRESSVTPANDRYMTRPGLSPDDYDT